MRCPDEMELELWLAEALPEHERETIRRHVDGCAVCLDLLAARRYEEAAISEALALQADELQFLADLDLAGRWRPVSATQAWWGWLALLVTMGALGAWPVAWPLARPALELAGRAGMEGLARQALLGALWTIGQTILNPTAILGVAHGLALVGLAIVLGLAALSQHAPAQPLASQA
jgi:hypothetical protein